MSFKAVSYLAFILINDDYISLVLEKLNRETSMIKTKTNRKYLFPIVHTALKSCKSFFTRLLEVSMFCWKTVLYAVNGQAYLTRVISTMVNIPQHIIAKGVKQLTLWENFGESHKRKIDVDIVRTTIIQHKYRHFGKELATVSGIVSEWVSWCFKISVEAK